MSLIEQLRAVAGDGYAYVATPYSKYPAGIEAAFEAACRATAWLLRHDVAVYCPIAHTHPIAIHGGIDPRDNGIWLKVDAPLMRAANGIIVVQMPTWNESYGVAHELEVFKSAGKPIVYLPWPLPEDGRGELPSRILGMTNEELAS